MENIVRKQHVYEEDQIEEFVGIAWAAVHVHGAPNWTMDLIQGGLHSTHLREMARRWREYEFAPEDFADRLELLADDLETEH